MAGSDTRVRFLQHPLAEIRGERLCFVLQFGFYFSEDEGGGGPGGRMVLVGREAGEIVFGPIWRVMNCTVYSFLVIFQPLC